MKYTREYSALNIGWRELYYHDQALNRPRWCLVSANIDILPFTIPGRYHEYDIGIVDGEEGYMVDEHLKEDYRTKKIGTLIIRRPLDFPTKYHRKMLIPGIDLTDPHLYPHYVEGKELVMWRIY